MLGIRYTKHARIAGVASPRVRWIELVESGHAKAPARQFEAGEGAHRAQSQNRGVEISHVDSLSSSHRAAASRGRLGTYTPNRRCRKPAVARMGATWTANSALAPWVVP